MTDAPQEMYNPDPLEDDEQEQDAPSSSGFEDWPYKGGSDSPQPWDNAANGIDPTQVGPGEPDTLSPVPMTHSQPILSSGSQGPAVTELCRLLAAAGFETSVSKGENAFATYDATVGQAVESFRSAYDVQEDPNGFGGNHPNGRAAAAAHVGPFTWEALYRVEQRGGE